MATLRRRNQELGRRRGLADPGTVYQNFDFATDGKRFVVSWPAEATGERAALTHVTFMLNFLDELQRRTAGK